MSIRRVIKLIGNIGDVARKHSKVDNPLFREATRELGEEIQERLLQGLIGGYDIDGKTFKGLKKSTLNIRKTFKKNTGTSPLREGGGLLKFLNSSDLVESGKVQVKLKSPTEEYMTLQNKGFITDSESMVPDKFVPARKWYGIPKTYKEGGTKYNEFLNKVKQEKGGIWDVEEGMIADSSFIKKMTGQPTQLDYTSQDSILQLADDLRDSSDVSDERDSSLIELSNVIGDTTKDDTFKANIFDYVSEGEMKAVWDSLTDKQKKMYGGDYSSFVSGRQAGFTNMVAYNKIDPDTLTKIEDKGKGALLEQAQGSKWKDVQPRHSFGTGNAIKKYSKRWDQDNTGRSSYTKKRPEGINTKEEWVLWKMLSQKGFGKIESKDIREQILFAEKAKEQDPSIELLFDSNTYDKLEEKVLKIISKTNT